MIRQKRKSFCRSQIKEASAKLMKLFEEFDERC